MFQYLQNKNSSFLFRAEIPFLSSNYTIKNRKNLSNFHWKDSTVTVL